MSPLRLVLSLQRSSGVLAALVVLLAGSAAAQKRTVVPSLYAKKEANNATTWPFGIATPIRVQYLYDQRLIVPQLMGIKQIALRGEGGCKNPRKIGVELEIGMSTTPTSPWKASKTFAANRGSNYKLVFTKKKVDLPPQPGTPTPQPFVTRFKLDSQFVYIKSNGNLLIEYVVHGQPIGKYDHDTSYWTLPKHTKIGTGCGGARLTVKGGDSWATPTILSYSMRGHPQGFGMQLIGLNKLQAALPLPLGGCLLRQDIVVLAQLRLDANGLGALSFPLSLDMKGLRLYGQFVSLDWTLKGIASTASYETVIGGVDPHTRIYDFSVTTKTGKIQTGLGIVTEVVY